MNRFFLLDRDGILNENKEFVYEPRQIVTPKSMIDILLYLKEKGFRFVVITNQSGIARGCFTVEELHIFNNALQSIYQKHGIFLEDFFYCPHLPEISGQCLCRKPKSLLVEKAIAKYQIDVKKSYMIGDHPRDTEAGKRAGLSTVLIGSQSHVHSDWCYESLTSFYENIKNCIL